MGGTGPTRRAVLGCATLGGGVLATAGCRVVATPDPGPPDPVLGEVHAAMAAEQKLIGLYTAALAAHRLPAARLHGPLDHHREHLRQLRRRIVVPSGAPSPTPSNTPTDTTHPHPDSLDALRDAEHAAAKARLAQLGRVPGALAQLLASIAACESAHVHQLHGA